MYMKCYLLMNTASQRNCGNLLEKKAFANEKYINQLNIVFFINITKDLQYIHPDKICMKCYLFMNTASQRNSAISLKSYETCVRATELSKGALGKIKSTTKNDQKGRPSLSKLFCCSLRPNPSD